MGEPHDSQALALTRKQTLYQMSGIEPSADALLDALDTDGLDQLGYALSFPAGWSQPATPIGGGPHVPTRRLGHSLQASGFAVRGWRNGQHRP